MEVKYSTPTCFATHRNNWLSAMPVMMQTRRQLTPTFLEIGRQLSCDAFGISVEHSPLGTGPWRDSVVCATARNNDSVTSAEQPWIISWCRAWRLRMTNHCNRIELDWTAQLTESGRIFLQVSTHDDNSLIVLELWQIFEIRGTRLQCYLWKTPQVVGRVDFKQDNYVSTRSGYDNRGSGLGSGFYALAR